MTRYTIRLALLLATVSFVSVPAEARFLQSDPVGYQSDPNLYTYVHNDPINNNDPSGMEPEWAMQYAAEEDAFRTCADWACFDQKMNAFEARDRANAALQMKIIGNWAALASGAEGVMALRGGYLAARSFLAETTASAAFKEAFSGGRYAGSLQQMARQSIASIQKAARSYEEQVEEHAAKIADPEKAVPNWSGMSEREQQGLLQKWQNDMQRNANLRDVMKDLAKLKEKVTCTGSRIPGNCP